jgi:hypothetical protein
MDQKFIEKVILIWMLFSIILENYFFHTSQATKYQNVSSCFDVDQILSILLKKKRNYSFSMFWIEFKQKIHWEEVEAIVWHTTSHMRDKKYLIH